MPRHTGATLLHRLLQIDMTIPLTAGALVLCGVGYAYGTRAALQVLLYGFLGLLALSVPALLLQAGSEQLQQLRRLQQRHGGRVRRGWVPYISTPSLTFEYRGQRARLTIDEGSVRYLRPAVVCLTTSWPDADVELLVRPRGVASRIARDAGLTSMEVGRPLFDEHYQAAGNGTAVVRQLLSREVHQGISQCPGQEQLLLQIRRGELLLQAAYTSPEDLAPFLEAALVVCDRLHNATVT